MSSPLTPLGAVIRGVVAGAAGTLAMDLVWYRRYRQSDGKDSFADWEFATGTQSYEEAAAPAQVGKRLVEGFTQKELPAHTAPMMTNLMHWLTGVGWGTFHAVMFTPAARLAQPLVGGVTGTVAWLTSYQLLSRAGLYKPMREYDTETLWKDLSAHLVFGAATGTAFALLRGKGD